MNQPLRTLALGVLLVASFGTAIAMQHRLARRLRAEPEVYRDSLYVPSARHARLVTFGYDQFAADYLWLRAIQTFGATFADRENVAQLDRYFDVISDLDPRFEKVYSFGNMVIGEEAGDHERGLELLDKGMIANPRRYRLPFEAAFFAYWTMNDPARAKYYVRMATKAPDCPVYVSSWMGYFETKMGRYEAALERYFQDFVQFHQSGDLNLARLRRLSLRRALDQWYTRVLRDKAIEYHAIHGEYPVPLSRIAEAGMLRDAEMPDWPTLRAILDMVEENGLPPDVPMERLGDLVRRSMRKGWDVIPPDPASDNPHFTGYLCWPGKEPFAEVHGRMEENELFVLSELRIADVLKHQTGFVRVAVAQANAAPGEQGVLGPFAPGESPCGPEARGLLEQAFPQNMKEPWGGEWVLDEQQCIYLPSTHPDFERQYLVAPKY